MKPDEQQIAIAEFCGVANRWVLVKRGLYYRPNACGYTDNVSDAWIVSEEEADSRTYPHDEPVTKRHAPLPDYLNDLNAMHDAALSLPVSSRSTYPRLLRQIVIRDAKPEMRDLDSGLLPDLYFYEATATQRAEALLRTIGKWTDNPIQQENK